MVTKKFKITALCFALLFSFSGLHATRYWVGNGGNWSDQSHWSMTSGGQGGASLPAEFDVVIFDQNSFSSNDQKVFVDQNVSVSGMNWSGVKFNPALEGASQFTFYGPVFLSEKMKNNFSGKVLFVFGTPTSYSSNFYGNDFKGEIDGKYDPDNIVIKKNQKNAGHTVLTAITAITTSSADADCGCNGWIKITSITGGTPPFTYTWSPTGPYSGEPTDSIYNLCPGVYRLRVTDSESFTRLTPNITISGPPDGPFSLAADPPVDNTCYQSCDGQLTISQALGGTYPYTYLWDDPTAQTDSVGDNLCAGTYTLTATDAAGCVQTYTGTVAEPTELLASILSQTNVDCGGASTGAATATASGGTAAYSYLWYDAPGTPAVATASNLPAGTYNCEVTDSHGCIDTATVIITEPTPLSITATTTQNILCSGVCIGQVTYSGSGGTGALTYSWYDIAGTPTTTPVSNLCAGTYHIEITDAAGCKDTATTAVTEPAALSATISDSTNVMCRGLCTGSAEVDAAGGVAPYTYNWYNLFAQTDSVAINMCAGASNVQVTDANGCIDTATVTITQPATTLFADIVAQTDNVCFGDCLGDATVRSSGGTLPHSYSWYDAPGLETDTVASNLCASTYNVEITDANNCLDTVSVTILEPTAVVGTFTDSIPLSCNGDCDGSLTVAGSGGTPGYTYLWIAPAGPVTPIVASLCAGSYSVQITDAAGCTGLANYDLIEPAVLNALIATQTNISCNSLCDGQLTAGPTGGTTPYNYDWYDNGNLTTIGVSSLCPGTYNVEVTDANGCIDTVAATITEPALLVASIIDSTNLLCGAVCNGDAEVGVAGGTAAYSYLWYDSGNQTTAIATNLCGGIHNVEVTDANGCIDTAQVNLDAPVSLTASISSFTDVTCNNACNGDATALGAGGVAPLTYSWYDAPVDPATAPISNLCAGVYNVEVSDLNGCKDTATVTISEPPVLVLNSGAPSNPSCKGVCSGVATVVPAGGTAPYTYNWYDAGGQTAATATSLCAGTYNVEVTDANGCIDTLAFIISEPAFALDVALTASTQATCNGICDATATVDASGGTAAYTYLWYDLVGTPTGASRVGLCEGTYNVEATDANGCKDTVTVPITAPVVVVADITGSTDATCNGFCDGDATVTAVGGTLPYTYDWTTAGNQVTTTATNLCSNFHIVTVTDFNGCSDTAGISITQPTAVVGTITDSTNILCNGVCIGDATVAAAGGNGPYDYLWYDVAGTPITQLVSNLCAGTYHAEITDAVGCIDTISVNIQEPAILNAAITATNISCNGLCDGAMTALPTSGGTAPYSYNWYDAGAQTSISISGLCVVTRNVEVTDANGCIDTATASITEPVLLTSSVTASSQPTCVGICNGGATATPAGGTVPYSYNWYTSGNQITASAVNMCAGNHSVEITDANGCKDTLAVPIIAPVVVVATIVDSTMNTCFGVCAGSATTRASGGASPYTYNWFTAGNQTDTTAINLCAGTHQAEVTDSNGCVDTATVIITQPAAVLATISDSTNLLCNGVCIGAATVNASGGTGPYTYDWYDVAGTPTDTSVSGLCAGTYHVEVTDANSCLDTTSVNITEPLVLSAAISKTDITCNALCDGMMTATPTSGGTAPYTYNWYDAGGQVTDTISGLCAGQLHVEVTDANGCIDTATATIIEPLVLSASVTASAGPSCTGDCDASATITPAGGTAPYTYNWYTLGNLTVDSIDNVCAGTYFVEVTDFNGCLDTLDVPVIDPLPVLATVTDSSATGCVGVCSGSALVEGSGGTAPYTYNWFTPGAGNQTDSLATNLCLGTQQVIATDANGCFDTASVNINLTNTPVTGVATDSVSVSCFTDCDGSATIVGTDGTGPYTYNWYLAGNQTDTTATNLCAGTNYVEVTDAVGCIDTASVIVITPLTLTLTKTSNNPACNSDTNGTASVVPAGGTAPYSHKWSNGSTSSFIFNLSPGTYIDTVTDAHGCVAIDSVILIDPVVVQTNAVGTTVSCPGMIDGLAYSIPSGGTGPFTFSWSNGSTNDSITGVAAGVYTVIVTDSLGCADTSAVTIVTPPALALSMSHNDAQCICNGDAKVTVAGGTPPYSYLWNDVLAQTTDSASGLCAGIYKVKVQDSFACEDSLGVSILNTSTLTGLMVDSIPTTCFGNCDGGATIRASGGDMPYTYLWNDPALTTDTTAINLCAGNYTVQVTDSNSCIYLIPVTISTPPAITGVNSVIMPLCFGDCNGTATLVPSGGNGGPYTHLWDTGSSNDSIFNLCAGTYNDTLTDAVGCTGVVPVIVNQPTVLTAAPTKTNVTCNGAGNGTANANVSGGTLPYTYLWDNPAADTTATLSNLVPGTYRVTVTDANGCMDLDSVIITEPLPLTSIISDSTTVNCNCVGLATIRGSGGTLPYSYLWNDPSAQTDSTATALCAGIYSGTITDANGCITASSVNIVDISGFSASITATTNLKCNAICIGSATITAVGGTLPYAYSWNDPTNQITATAVGLCAGNYTGIVTDQAGCQYILPTTITQPTAISINLITTNNVTCAGYCDGVLTASASGGTGSVYTYSWNDAYNQTTPVADSLCPSNYTITVSDSVGCIKTASQTITEPLPLIAAITSSANVSCNGLCDGAIHSTGIAGTAPYTYAWDSGPTTKNISALCANTYKLTVTDFNGCQDDTSYTITQPSALLASISDSTKITCNGVCDGTATVLASGGTAPFTYSWYDAPGLETDTAASNLCATTYHARVTDAHGCRDTAQITFVAPSVLSLSLVSTTPTKCFNDCNGEALVSALGGRLPYTYLWNDPLTQNTAAADSLCAGNYNCTVTDSSGCTAVLPVTITQPVAVSVNIVTTSNASCGGKCDGILTASASGGTGPFTYSWNDAYSQNTAVADSLCAINYTVTATDSLGCLATANQTITEPLAVVATITMASNVTCFGKNDGFILALGTGGTPNYTYSWDSGQTSAGIATLGPNTYKVTITDANGCSDDTSYTITEPSVLVASITDSTKITCNLACDGTATALGSGGTFPYSYYWYDAPNDETVDKAEDLCAQTYHAEVTDANGCVDTAQITFIDPPALSLSLVSSTPAKCFNDCNGTAVVSGSGGTGALSYTWVGGQTGTSPVTLCAGKNTVTLKDANNCPKTLDVNIGQPAQPVQVLITNVVHLLCATINDGSATAKAVGGNGGFSYSWDDPLNQTGVTASNLGAGTYIVTATDLKGCQDTESVVINTTNAFNPSIVETQPVLCHDDCNGELRVLIAGGVPGGSVDWVGPSITPANKFSKIVKDLCSGNYFVTVTDGSATGCSTSLKHTLTNPLLLAPSISDSVNVLCKGDCTGTATAAVGGIGGTPPYTFQWNNSLSATTSIATQLCATQQYRVDVTDFNGCVKSAYVQLTEPAFALSAMNTTSPAACTNTNEGAIAEIIAGGVMPYNTSWTKEGSSTFKSFVQNPAGLYPGKYYVTIKDQNLCEIKDSATIIATTFIDANAGADTTICRGDSVVLKGSGGVTYLWSTGKATASITETPSISPTSYILTAINGGCTDKDTVKVTVNDKPTADITVAQNIVLEGNKLTLYGNGAGIGGTYDWLPPTSLDDPTLQNPTATPIKSTTYILTVTNSSGCSDSASTFIKVSKGIVFPDGITPNGDGLNDSWVIDLIDQFPQCKVEIFNRWGQQVFQSSGYVQSWDGEFNHIPLPVGTYYYIIDLGPGLPKYTGPITLMR